MAKRTDSFVMNCFIETRADQDGPIFRGDGDGNVLARLDGYAIIPLEKYKSLLAADTGDRKRH